MDTFRNDCFIDGKWQPSTDGPEILVENPAERKLAGTCAEASLASVNKAVGAASRAFPEWSTLFPAQRARYLRSMAQALESRRDEIARLITDELGMPLRESWRIQVGRPIASLTIASRVLDTHQFVHPSSKVEGAIPSDMPFTIYEEPAGVVAAIAPWNYPLHQAMGKVAWALAAGCTVVLKPSELTPLNAYALGEIAEEIGLPEGVLNIVPGGAQTGMHLVENPEVDVVSFTGSPQAGTVVMETAAKRHARVCLELGGKSAAILLPGFAGADVPSATRSTIAACFLNSGQTCNATTRFIVPDYWRDEVVETCEAELDRLVTGHPLDDNTNLGPLISERHWQRAGHLVAEALDDGGKFVARGRAPRGGTYFAPAVIELPIGARGLRDEYFAPVLSLITYDPEHDDPIDIANDSPYGLSATVWTVDEDEARVAARMLRVGQVEVGGVGLPLTAPFGGYKGSGFGREQGVHALAEFQEIKAVS